MGAEDNPTPRQLTLVQELFDQYEWYYPGLDEGCRIIYGKEFSRLNRGQMGMVIDDLFYLAGRKEDKPTYRSLEGFITSW